MHLCLLHINITQNTSNKNRIPFPDPSNENILRPLKPTPTQLSLENKSIPWYQMRMRMR